MKTTTDTQEVENNTIAKNDSNLEENPLSNNLSQKSIEEEPKVKFFKNPEYIDYIKTTIDKNYTVKEVEVNTHFHQFDQLLANALLNSDPSLTDYKHILEDGIFLDSIPSHIRHNKDELDFSIFRKDGVIKGSDENLQVLQPADEQEYYNTISAQSYTNHSLLSEGIANVLGLKDFIVHRTAETDPLKEEENGYFNKIGFHRIEIDKTTLKDALYTRVAKKIDKIKTILDM